MYRLPLLLRTVLLKYVKYAAMYTMYVNVIHIIQHEMPLPVQITTKTLQLLSYNYCGKVEKTNSTSLCELNNKNVDKYEKELTNVLNKSRVCSYVNCYQNSWLLHCYLTYKKHYQLLYETNTFNY